jgi:hypothetical protein
VEHHRCVAGPFGYQSRRTQYASGLPQSSCGLPRPIGYVRFAKKRFLSEAISYVVKGKDTVLIRNGQIDRDALEPRTCPRMTWPRCVYRKPYTY